MHLAEKWQNRPLDKVYPIVFFDAIHSKSGMNQRKLFLKLLTRV
jgi:transposase-like protein